MVHNQLDKPRMRKPVAPLNAVFHDGAEPHQKKEAEAPELPERGGQPEQV